MDTSKEFIFEMEEIHSCPLCGSEDIETFTNRTYKLAGSHVALLYFQCKSCTHIFMNPRPTQESYTNLYNSGAYRAMLDSPGTGGPTLMNYGGEAVRGQSVLQELMPRIMKGEVYTTSIVDVGGSTGMIIFMLAHEIAKNLGVTTKGLNVEPDDVFANEGRKMGIAQVHSMSQAAPYAPFDIALCIHVLEHQNDVLTFLKEFVGLGNQRTFYYIDVPHTDSPKTAYSAFHPQAFTRESLDWACEQAGLQVLVHKYRVLRTETDSHFVLAKRKDG